MKLYKWSITLDPRNGTASSLLPATEADILREAADLMDENGWTIPWHMRAEADRLDAKSYGTGTPVVATPEVIAQAKSNPLYSGKSYDYNTNNYSNDRQALIEYHGMEPANTELEYLRTLVKLADALAYKRGLVTREQCNVCGVGLDGDYDTHRPECELDAYFKARAEGKYDNES